MSGHKHYSGVLKLKINLTQTYQHHHISQTPALFSSSRGKIINQATDRNHEVKDNVIYRAFWMFWVSRYLCSPTNHTNSKHVIDWRSKSPPTSKPTTPPLPTHRYEKSQDLTILRHYCRLFTRAVQCLAHPPPPHTHKHISEAPLLYL
jgi:hypothetical protein